MPFDSFFNDESHLFGTAVLINGNIRGMFCEENELRDATVCFYDRKVV